MCVCFWLFILLVASVRIFDSRSRRLIQLSQSCHKAILTKLTHLLLQTHHTILLSSIFCTFVSSWTCVIFLAFWQSESLLTGSIHIFHLSSETSVCMWHVSGRPVSRDGYFSYNVFIMIFSRFGISILRGSI